MVAGISAISFSMMPRADKFVIPVTNVKGVTSTCLGGALLDHALAAGAQDLAVWACPGNAQQGARARFGPWPIEALLRWRVAVSGLQGRRQLRRALVARSEATSRK